MPCPYLYTTRNCKRDPRLHEAHLPSPILGVLEKIENLLALIGSEVVLTRAGVQDIVPIGESDQLNFMLRQIFLSLMQAKPIRGVVENTQTVGHLGSCPANADIK